MPDSTPEEEFPLFDRLFLDRICSIDAKSAVGKPTVYIQEECDQCFATELTKAEMLQLADEIKRIADTMI